MQGIRYYFSTVLFRGKSAGADQGTANTICPMEFPDRAAEKSASRIDGQNVNPVDPMLRNQRVLSVSALYRSTILEGEHQPPIVVCRGLLHHRQPEPFVKLGNGIAALGQFKHKSADGICLYQPLVFLFLECAQLGLCRIVSGHITVIAFGVLLLTLRAPGVFLDTPLGQLRHHRNLSEQLVQFRVNGSAVGEVVLHNAAVPQQSPLAVQQLVERYQKPGLDILLHQMRGAARFLTIELFVALPDGAAVLAVGVPDLGTVESAAVAADDAGGENAAAAIAMAQLLAPLILGLHQIKLLRVDDGLVALFNVILRDLALVDFLCFIEEIYRKALLKERRPLVLLICEDRGHRGGSPFRLASRGRDTIRCERLSDLVS